MIANYSLFHNFFNYRKKQMTVANGDGAAAVLLTFCLLLSGSTPPAALAAHFRPVFSRPCLSQSMSEWALPTPAASMLRCTIMTRSKQLSGIGVVQVDRRHSVCSLFLFSRVCHLLSLSSPAAAPSLQSDCELIVDSKLDALAANKHFAAVWIGNRGPQLENLVCGAQGQKNPVGHADVVWTGDGARMNGMTSRMWVTDGMDFSNAFTWLMEVKRTPKSNALIEMTDCSSFAGYWLHLWEWDDSAPTDTRRPYIQTWYHNLVSKQMIMSASSEQFVRVGGAFDLSMVMSKLYLNGAYLPDSAVNLQNHYFPQPVDFCIKIGWRDQNGYYGKLLGTVKMVAFSNNYLTEEAINELYNL